MSTDSDILMRAEQTPQAFAEAVVSMMGATMVTAPAIGSQMNGARAEADERTQQDGRAGLLRPKRA